MLVSAIIPCYNAASTISRAIESVLNQTTTVDEIIVINDGSTDNSLEEIQGLKKLHDSIVVIHQDNKGVCAARNAGIEFAQGTYLLTLDADDYFEDSFVEKALLEFKKDKDYGAIMCGYVRVVNGKKVTPYIPPKITLASCLMNNGALSCLLFKKEAVVKAGLYDEGMHLGYEDWDLNIRILKEGYRYGVVREVLFNYTDTASSRNDHAESKDLELRMQLFDKYRQDYKQHDAYFFKEFIKENHRLRKENQRIKNSRSFKWSHSIISLVERLKKIVKTN
ncbi:hypothetical protein LX97_01709 [Nonlabens dokdonensis]|jgi:glycosyltransferase involved in cell wall biosynthesis|uniref:Glycosyl transferase, family 2 n=2 Tax=Nonlabens dokdonensis TaxID=328515 RepID=L7W6V5_NONDD|nr:glycosyltransferase family A protein [Nonlabens dokdonensis]AGC77410.1 glycosyl transferase, family 2 [Nonlabens dokdonensis DSW-6]PZX40936.1 hypothetical protein LX97_01709 [Nonlabens dokdonensis]